MEVVKPSEAEENLGERRTETSLEFTQKAALKALEKHSQGCEDVAS